MRKQIGLAVLIALGATCAQAADETGKLYVNPQVGYLFTDDTRQLDDDLYYGVGFGKHVTPEWSVEFNAIQGTYDRKAGGEADIRAYSLDLLRVFGREKKLSPFVSGGVGYMEDTPTVGHTVGNPLLQLGGGLMIDLFESKSNSFLLQLRPEVKVRWDTIEVGNQKDHYDYMAGIGVLFAFGGAQPAPAPMAVAAAPPPPPAPAPAPAAAPPPPPPPLPPPPVDTDGDGVVDGKDQCPATPRGEPVDAMGCGFQVRLSVQFENDSAKLKSESLPELDAAAALLNRVPSITAVVEGHTDSVGDAGYNEKLSQKRAQAVTDYLVGKGVNTSRLQAKGLGESQPVADNATAEGRAENRRVILRRTDATK